MEANRDPRIVLVHDWLTGMRGGEKCLEVLCRRWTHAPLFTLLHQPGSVSPSIESRPIRASFLQRLPSVYRYYRYLLPFMPAAAAGWRLPPADLVVSLSHCVAKAVQPPAGVPHICYCFTPMRYAWHLREAYFGAARFGRLKSWLTEELLLQRLRVWDQETSARVTRFVAISRTVQRRIAECYGRDSTVIYPPVDTDFFCPAPVKRQDFYLAVSAFAPYKRLDLAITACNRLRRSLVIIGEGQEERKLRRLAGPTVHFLGWQDSRTMREYLRSCRALLFPGEEDFGIVPVEAQACGTPVIAFGRGGAVETVLPMVGRREPTGILFEEQSTECLASAMEAFETHAKEFRTSAARRQALQFNRRRFEEEFVALVGEVLSPTPMSVIKAA